MGQVRTSASRFWLRPTRRSADSQSINVVAQGKSAIRRADRRGTAVCAEAHSPMPMVRIAHWRYPRIRSSDPNIYLDNMRAINTYNFMEWRPDPFTLSHLGFCCRRHPSCGDADQLPVSSAAWSPVTQALATTRSACILGNFNRKQIQFAELAS